MEVEEGREDEERRGDECCAVTVTQVGDNAAGDAIHERSSTSGVKSVEVGTSTRG